MSIAEAIRLAATSAGWTVTKVAVEAGVSEASARAWMSDRTIPSGDKLEILRAKLPGLSALLNDRGASQVGVAS